MLHPKGDAVGVTDAIQKIQAAQSSFASMDPTVGCQGGFFKTWTAYVWISLL